MDDIEYEITAEDLRSTETICLRMKKALHH